MPKHPRGLIDTSVIVELDGFDPDHLPDELSISAISLAELAAGPHATNDVMERSRRQERLQLAEATLPALAFDARAARAYGRLFAAVASAGRKARGRRAAELMIAATAVAAGLPVYTRNAVDFQGLDSLLEVVALKSGVPKGLPGAE